MSSDEEWELVANPARVKREARKERKAQRDEELEEEKRMQYYLDAEEMSREVSALKRNVPAPSRSAAEAPSPQPQSMSSRRAAKNARKGKSKSSSKPAKIPQSEEDLIEFLQKLLELESKPLTIAELGARVQTSTKTSWNKAFKSSYGAMDKFLKTHEVFNVEKKSGETMVALQAWKPVKKKAARSAAQASSSSPPRPDVSKRRVSFAEPVVRNRKNEKKSSKASAAAAAAAAETSNVVATSKNTNSKSKKSKRKRKSENSNGSSSLLWSLVKVLLLVVALGVSGILVLKFQNEALFNSYQEKVFEFMGNAPKGASKNG